MQLHKIRGGSEEELEAKTYNIGVGISLGNKWFSTENIVELVKWALPYTREYVVIYVADSIHAINLEVRNRLPADRAMLRSTAKGKEVLSGVEKQITQSFSEEDIKRIVYVYWNEIVDAEYEKKLAYLIRLYYENEAFSKVVKSIVKNSVTKETRPFSEEQITKLGTYLLHEMPELLGRVPMSKYECDAYIYPYDNEITQLMERIQKGEIFPEIKDAILDTKPKVFLEVR